MNDAVSAFAGPAILAIFFLLILWDRYRNRAERRSRVPVQDCPEDEPYRIFTDSFDLVLRAEDLPVRLEKASLDGLKGWTDRTGRERKAALELNQGYRVAFAHSSPLRPGLKFEGLAVTLLIDQSGSMKGRRMAAVVAALEQVSAAFTAAGAHVEILGFSTVGWHGGRAYKAWVEKGKSKRPGRLCALLHIIYKTTDQEIWNDTSRRMMLHPDILRENVDGEALRWAVERSRSLPAKQRAVLVISDGAPVDDATLMHNGISYLERDLKKVIAEIENAEDIRLGAVGIDHDVGRYYARSVTGELDDLPNLISEQIVALAR